MGPMHLALPDEESILEPPCLEVGGAGCETACPETQRLSKKHWLPNSGDRQQLCHTGARSRTELLLQACSSQMPIGQNGCWATL